MASGSMRVPKRWGCDAREMGPLAVAAEDGATTRSVYFCRHVMRDRNCLRLYVSSMYVGGPREPHPPPRGARGERGPRVGLPARR